jgi:hypothetical protein
VKIGERRKYVDMLIGENKNLKRKNGGSLLTLFLRGGMIIFEMGGGGVDKDVLVLWDSLPFSREDCLPLVSGLGPERFCWEQKKIIKSPPP